MKYHTPAYKTRFTLPVFIAVTLCFSNSHCLSAQNEQPSTSTSPSSPPIVLKGTGKKISLNFPMFGAEGNAVCDSSGNFFFHVSHSGIPFKGFLGIAADGSSHTLYSLPSEIGSLGNAWTVSPDGILYVLHGDFKKYQLIRFKRDGSVGRTIPVDIPAGVLVQYLAVADSGTLYIQGYRDSVHGKEKPEFASLFDDSGKLIRDLKKDGQKIDTGSFATGLQEGDAIAGTNGRFYVLEPAHVLSISQGGEVEQVLDFQKPESGSYATRIDYSNGLISIGLDAIHSVPNRASEIVGRFLLLDAQTGELRGSYVFDPDLTGTVLCFSREDGYSLFAIDHKMAAKEMAPLR